MSAKIINLKSYSSKSGIQSNETVMNNNATIEGSANSGKNSVVNTCFKCGGDFSLSSTVVKTNEIEDVKNYLCKKCAIGDIDKSSLKKIRSYYVMFEDSYSSKKWAWDERNGRVLTFKHIKYNIRQKEKFQNWFEGEISFMKKLRHRNIIQPYDAWLEDNGDCYYVIAYMYGGNIYERVWHKNLEYDYDHECCPHTITLPCKFALEVLNGLDYLHKKGYVYEQLSISNILIGWDCSQNDIVQMDTFTVVDKYITKENNLNSNDMKDPSCDTYNLGQIMYYVMCSSLLPEAETSTSNAGAYKIDLLDVLNSEYFKSVGTLPEEDTRHSFEKINKVIMKSISSDPAKRFKTAKGFRNTLKKSIDWCD